MNVVTRTRSLACAAATAEWICAGEGLEAVVDHLATQPRATRSCPSVAVVVWPKPVTRTFLPVFGVSGRRPALFFRSVIDRFEMSRQRRGAPVCRRPWQRATAAVILCAASPSRHFSRRIRRTDSFNRADPDVARLDGGEHGRVGGDEIGLAVVHPGLADLEQQVVAGADRAERDGLWREPVERARVQSVGDDHAVVAQLVPEQLATKNRLRLEIPRGGLTFGKTMCPAMTRSDPPSSRP